MNDVMNSVFCCCALGCLFFYADEIVMLDGLLLTSLSLFLSSSIKR